MHIMSLIFRNPTFLSMVIFLLSLLAIPSLSWPAEVVHFPSAKLAFGSKESEKSTKVDDAAPRQAGYPIWGHLAIPKGDGPFPAVILMHGCAGIVSGQFHWASLLNDLGYVTLILDSYRPRSVLRTCSKPLTSVGPEVRALDAHGALAYLARLPFVAADRVAVAGWSDGGIAALGAVAASGISARLLTSFSAAIAFYPYCIARRNFELPVLILMGESDDWTPVEPCRALAGQNQERGTVQLVVYPDAVHAFDEPELTSGFKIKGADEQFHLLQFNKAAYEDAKSQVRTFLAEQLNPKR